MKIKNIILTIFIIILCSSCGQNKKNEMGIFSNLFGGKSEKSNKINHQEDWDFYLTNVDDKLSSIAVDLGLKSVAPIVDKQNVVWISLKMNNPREDGLSSDEEFEKLGNIEDEIVNSIVKNHNAIFVGRLTSDNHRDFYFYFGETKNYEQTVSEVMQNFSDYKYGIGTKIDKEWDGYLNFLFPLPEQYQRIQNRKVVDNLVKNGDKLEAKREVMHWIYFTNENDRENFIKKIGAENFKVEEKNKINENKEFPYNLRISRIDKVDYENIDEYTIYLWKLASENNGEYDGWETSVEK
jgi:uncharacterized protein (TIGR01619 family)